MPSVPPPPAAGEQRRLPKVPSLLFDMEMEDGRAAAASSEEMEVDLVESELCAFLKPTTAAHKQLIDDVGFALSAAQRAQGAGASVDAVALLEALTSAASGTAYRVRLIRAVGGGEGSSCLHNLRHTFLVATPPGGRCGNFIVDAHFAEQFEIAKPSPRYVRIMNCIPEVLVLPEERCPPLVTFLCAELAVSFKACDTVVPPWRQASSMLSKWLPRRSLDVDLSSAATRSFAGAQSRNAQQGAADAAARPAQGMDDLGSQLLQMDREGRNEQLRAMQVQVHRSGLHHASTNAKMTGVVPLALKPNKVMGGFHGGYLHTPLAHDIVTS
mmetsp:Transcript_25717/g.76102  ORF Transcript_25717/g.76102 Transcript_25717/m.76102 type:complete len:327 (-) Transcript_25717:1208-2188(-)